LTLPQKDPMFLSELFTQRNYTAKRTIQGVNLFLANLKAKLRMEKEDITTPVSKQFLD